MLKYTRVTSRKTQEVIDIYAKFKTGLLEIIKKENIKYKEIFSINELNGFKDGEEVPAEKKGNLAVGHYVHLNPSFVNQLSGWQLELSKIEYPKIEVLCDNSDDFKDCEYGNTLTLAHELGHHFCIKEKNDNSEDGANAYVLTLAEQVLTPREIFTIGIPLRVKSKMSDEEFNKKYNYETLYPFEEYLKQQTGFKGWLARKYLCHKILHRWI